MPDFYYTDQSGGSVRVAADIYEENNLPAQPGQCLGVTYRVTGTVYAYRAPGSSSRVFVNSPNRFVIGPITEIRLHRDSNNYFLTIEHGGGTSTGNLGNVRAGFGHLDWAPGPFINRVDGQPDNCGGSCTMHFIQDGQTFHSLDYCPDVSETPPGCPCCAELLPLLRGLNVC